MMWMCIHVMYVHDFRVANLSWHDAPLLWATHPLSNQLISMQSKGNCLYFRFQEKNCRIQIPNCTLAQTKEKVNKNLLYQKVLLNLCVQPCVGNSQHNHILGRPFSLLFYVGEVPHSKSRGSKTVEQNKVNKSCSTK